MEAAQAPPSVPPNKRRRLLVSEQNDGNNNNVDDEANSSIVLTITNLPDVVLDLIISCFTSFEMASQFMTISKEFHKATERVAEAIVDKERKEKGGWSLLIKKHQLLEYERPWIRTLFQLENLIQNRFHFDSLRNASHFFRHRRLGRKTAASFNISCMETAMIHASFGGLIQFMGGVTPDKCLFARSELAMESGIYRFIIQIYYLNSLMLGGRDSFSVGLVNKDYKHFSFRDDKKPTKKEQKMNDLNSSFIKIPPLDSSLGNRSIFGLVVDFDSHTIELIKPTQYTPAATTSLPQQMKKSFFPLTGPLFFAVRQEYDPKRSRMGRRRGVQYGNHDFAIRESKDEGEWNNLFFDK